MKLINSNIKNDVLQSMITIIDRERKNIIEANKKDLAAFNKDDQALYDRLVVNEAKVDGMRQAIKEVKEQEDPVGKEISDRTLDSGLKIINKICFVYTKNRKYWKNFIWLWCRENKSKNYCKITPS